MYYNNINMTIADKLEELEQRIYELECVLKHYPVNKDFVPQWMHHTATHNDGTIDIEWDYEL